MMSFPRIFQLVRCPVPGCSTIAHSAGRLLEHFMFRHFWSQIAVVQEGREPLPRCDMCIMHMPTGQLLKHRRTACCFKNTEMRIRRRGVEFTSWCVDIEFSLTGKEGEETIKLVALFKCLGRPLEHSDDDWPEVIRNIGRARQVWGKI